MQATFFTEEGRMFATKRARIAAAALAVALTAGGVAAAVTTSASASAKPAHTAAHKTDRARHHKLSLNRFDLNGWVINAKYTLGRNTGNTFQQTYGDSMVQGVPIAGPFVGTKFPPEDYVALPIGHHELYITWLDPNNSFAIVDVFVMNFKTHTVYDYAPGSTSPESAGTIKVVKRGAHPIP
jgi:hypothetical protein